MLEQFAKYLLVTVLVALSFVSTPAQSQSPKPGQALIWLSMDSIDGLVDWAAMAQKKNMGIPEGLDHVVPDDNVKKRDFYKSLMGERLILKDSTSPGVADFLKLFRVAEGSEVQLAEVSTLESLAKKLGALPVDSFVRDADVKIQFLFQDQAEQNKIIGSRYELWSEVTLLRWMSHRTGGVYFNLDPENLISAFFAREWPEKLDTKATGISNLRVSLYRRLPEELERGLRDLSVLSSISAEAAERERSLTVEAYRLLKSPMGHDRRTIEGYLLQRKPWLLLRFLDFLPQDEQVAVREAVAKRLGLAPSELMRFMVHFKELLSEQKNRKENYEFEAKIGLNSNGTIREMYRSKRVERRALFWYFLNILGSEAIGWKTNMPGIFGLAVAEVEKAATQDVSTVSLEPALAILGRMLDHTRLQEVGPLVERLVQRLASEQIADPAGSQTLGSVRRGQLIFAVAGLARSLHLRLSAEAHEVLSRAILKDPTSNGQPIAYLMENVSQLGGARDAAFLRLSLAALMAKQSPRFYQFGDSDVARMISMATHRRYTLSESEVAAIKAELLAAEGPKLRDAKATMPVAAEYILDISENNLQAMTLDEIRASLLLKGVGRAGDRYLTRAQTQAVDELVGGLVKNPSEFFIRELMDFLYLNRLEIAGPSKDQFVELGWALKNFVKDFDSARARHLGLEGRLRDIRQAFNISGTQVNQSQNARATMISKDERGYWWVLGQRIPKICGWLFQ